MSHRSLLAPLGLVLALAIPETLPAQTAVAAAAPRVTDQAVVTGTSSSVSAREAALTFFLSDGGQRVITLRDGAVLVNGEQIATYATDGEVEREWRRLVAWTATLSPDEAVAAGREWAVEGTFDAQDQSALSSIADQFAMLMPGEVVTIAHGPPDHLEEAMVAAAEAREAGRIARDEIARVRDVIRVNVRDRVRDNVRIAVDPEPHVSMVTPFGGLAAGLLGLGGTFAALCTIAFGASFFAGKQIDVMADTVSTSFGRSFFVGLFAQPLILPALVAVLVGLTLTVVGVLLVPVAIVAFAATLAAAVVGGYLAVARVAGSGMMQRLRGHHGTHPLGLLQSIAWGARHRPGRVAARHPARVAPGGRRRPGVARRPRHLGARHHRVRRRRAHAGRCAHHLWASLQAAGASGRDHVRAPRTRDLHGRVVVEQGTMKRLLLTILLATLAHPLSAQELLSRVETRKVDGNGLFTVNVSFAVGKLLVRPASGRLYRVALDYADVFDPTIRFDPAGRSLSIKLDGEGSLHGEDLEDLDQRLSLDLPRNVPLDLTLEFGALEADIDLGELMLRTGKIRAGASHTTVSFSGATRGVCERLDFEVGAAEFAVKQLGNSGCRQISLKGAVGEMTLDFSGDHWAEETRLFIKVGLGEVRIRIPESVGIRLDANRFLASVSRAGLVKDGSAFVSPGFDRAETKLFIEVDAALGSVEIERIR